jgi:hypothetical protein
LSIKKTYAQKLSLFLKGFAMGTANKVPGVSGGAVAFVLGFYEELIYTFQKINGKALKLLVNGRFKSLAAYLNLSFLFWVMGGSLFSYFSLSVVLDYFLQTYELYVWSLFFGMIIGSVYYIGKRFAAWTYQNTVVALLGLCIGLALSFLPPAKENSNLWFVFLCGNHRSKWHDFSGVVRFLFVDFVGKLCAFVGRFCQCDFRCDGQCTLWKIRSLAGSRKQTVHQNCFDFFSGIFCRFGRYLSLVELRDEALESFGNCIDHRLHYGVLGHGLALEKKGFCPARWPCFDRQSKQSCLGRIPAVFT